MKGKMIVIDLDGTLLNINKGCSNESCEYLKKLKDLGYVIVIASGRVLKDCVSVTNGAEFANYIIANSGGLIYDMDNKKVIKNNSIDKLEVRRILESYNSDMEYITLCDLYYYNRYGYNDIKMDFFYDRNIDDIDKFLLKDYDIFHMIVRFRDDSLVDKYYKMFDSDKIDVLVMQDSFNERKWLEIFGEGVNKYNSIKYISKLENISNDNVIAFGDGRNDIEMIKNVGIGVAMGNALDDVKEVSKYVTISHNKDGVIYFLKKYIDENNLVS